MEILEICIIFYFDICLIFAGTGESDGYEGESIPANGYE
jgi:hypothetical protein